jgi:hypothetical protein
MRADLDKRWLLPFGILAVSALIALGIVILKPSFTNLSSTEVAQPARTETNEAAPPDCLETSVTTDTCEQKHNQAATSGPSRTEEIARADCSGASAADYICYQQRYQNLVHSYGVEAAFAQLRGEVAKDKFANSNCHELSHAIGRATVDLYSGDMPTVYSHGDTFCGSGYYHGAMESVVARIGPDAILENANTLCNDLSGHQMYSVYHYNCAHGLGHGFMGIKGNELYDALRTCDALTDSWERNRCYGGVFMENVIDKDDPEHPSKYLKADQPLYPCDVVGNDYKNECYQRQTSYALQTQDNDFSKVFDLCAKVDDDFRQACYQGLGWDALVQSLKQDNSDEATNGSTRTLCSLGRDYEARFNCVVGAVDYFIRNYYSDSQAKSFCGYLSADLRAPCLQEAEEYYTSLEFPLERLEGVMNLAEKRH